MADIVENTVFMLFNLCFNKLEDGEKAHFYSLIPTLQTATVETFYQAVLALDISAENSEQMAVTKAFKSKIVSWYNREFKKTHPQQVTRKAYQTLFKDKEKTVGGSKVNKKEVPITDPMQNDSWNQGVTKFCMKLVSVGLASFGTFASYFVYRDSSIPNAYYLAKLMADKERGGKKVVFVRN